MTLAEAGEEFDPAFVESGYWEADGADEATLRLLDRTPGITVVYARIAAIALGVLSVLRERGLTVPED